MKAKFYFRKISQLTRLTLAFLLFNTLIIGGAFSQAEVCLQIGVESTPSNNYPFAGASTHSYVQQIYTANELFALDIEGGDNIEALQFNYFWETPTKRPIKIFLANTSLENFNNGWFPSTELTEVFFSDCQEFSKGDDNWTKISFTNSFEYSGENIVVAILMNKEDATDPTSCFTEASETKRFNMHLSTLNSSYMIKIENDTSITFDEETGYPKQGNNILDGAPWQIRSNIKFCKTGVLCPRPTGVVATNITASSLTLGWWPGSTETSWTIEYGESGFTQGGEGGTILEASSNPIEITNLSGVTIYDFYIRANCSEDTQSNWQGPISFNTACGAINSQNFIEEFTDNSQNLECWTIIDVNEDSGTTSSGKWVFINNEARYSHKSNNAADDWLISPKINFAENKSFAFDYKVGKAEKPEKFSVHIITGASPEDYATSSVEILPVQEVNNTSYITIKSMSLQNYINQDIYIAIKCESEAKRHRLFIDNFKIYTPSTGNDIISFSLPSQKENTAINEQNHTIDIEVSMSSDLSNLTPTIILSKNATIEPASGEAQNFSSPVTYTVKAENGSPQDWLVTVTKADTLSASKDIISFNFSGQKGTALIDKENHTVVADISWFVSLTDVIPEIKISHLASISPESGIEQDFTSEDGITYTITAENASSQIWNVKIKKEEKPVGADCQKPFNLNLTEQVNPYLIENETTDNFFNSYSNTGLGTYDDGQDKVYKLSVSENLMYDIKINSESPFVGMGIFIGCPSENKLIKKVNKSTAGEQTLKDLILYSGVEYYLMVDKRKEPNFIPSYDLTFTKNENPPCLSPTDLSVSNILQTSVNIEWSQILNETEWELRYCIAGENIEIYGIDITENVSSPFNLTGLNQHTAYSISIRSKCSQTEYGEWSKLTSFITSESCPIPTDLAEVSTTTNTATITWDAHNTSNWLVQYRLTTEADYQSVEVNENPYTISNLEHSKTYIFRIKAICEGEEDSYYSTPANFTTKCDIISTFPYLEEFYDNSASVGCWTIIDANNDSGTSNSGKWRIKTNRAIYTYSVQNDAKDWLISPQFRLEEGLSLQFDYCAKKADKEEKFSVYLITGESPNDYTSATKILPTQTINNIEYITIPPISLHEYANQDVFLAIKCESKANKMFLHIDNFKVYKPSAENDIISFSFPSEITPATINNELKTVNIQVSQSANLAELSPSITVSDFATISPESNTPQDFSENFTYKVTAENGEEQNWIITVTKATELIATKEITSFKFPLQVGDETINSEEGTVSAKIKWFANLTDITPSIGISPLASISPASDIPQNFTNIVEYTVKAENNSEKGWKISITNQENPCIAGFDIPFSETFTYESPSVDCWNIIDKNSDGEVETGIGMWKINTSEAYAEYIKSPTNAAEDWLISPRINLTSNSSLSFEFKTGSILNEKFSVWILKESNSDTENVENLFSSTQITTGSEWQAINKISLINFINQNVYIGIKCESNANSFKLNIRNFKIIKEENQYLMSSASGENGSIEPEGTYTVNEGAIQKYTIKPDQGYTVNKMFVDFIEKTEALTDNTYTFENIQSNHNINVTFKLIPKHTLKASVEGGNGTITPTEGTVNVGDNFEFTITAADGYELEKLTDNGTNKTDALTGNKYLLANIQENHEIVVKFKQSENPIPTSYLLTASVFGGNGSITPISETVNAGADFEFTITPAQAYILDNLKDNNTDKTDNVAEGKYKLTNIQENHEIVVKFKNDIGITEESILDINIYPNPTYELLNIEVSEEILKIEILSIDGKLIHKQNVQNNKCQYQTNSLAEGNYFVKIYTENKLSIKQFTIKK